MQHIKRALRMRLQLFGLVVCSDLLFKPSPAADNRIGTSAALYGLFSFDIFGTISATYTMDGFPISKTYAVNASSPEFTSGVKQLENYLLYSNDSLSSGDHTLRLQITNCVSQTFALDYIIYTPSFATLASKPSLPISSQSSSGSPNTSPTVLQTSSLSSLQSSNPSSTLVTSKPGTQSNASTSSSPPKAAIIGGVLGGVIFLALLLLFWLLWRRTSKRRTLLQPISPTGVFPAGIFPLSHRVVQFQSLLQ